MKNKLPPPSHNDVQKQVTDWLAYKHIYCYPVPNRSKPEHRHDDCESGASDLVAVVKGLYVGIEIKAKGDKQGKDQLRFQQNVEKAGGIYILAYSIDDIEPVIEKILNGAVLICTGNVVKM